MRTRNEYLRNINQFIEEGKSEVGLPLVGSSFDYNGYRYQVIAEVNNLVYLVCIEEGVVPEFTTLTYKDLEKFGFELLPPEYTIWDLVQVLAQEVIIKVRGSGQIFADGARLIQIDYEKPQLRNLSDEDLQSLDMFTQALKILIKLT